MCHGSKKNNKKTSALNYDNFTQNNNKTLPRLNF